jgi:hypothetical protein
VPYSYAWFRSRSNVFQLGKKADLAYGSCHRCLTSVPKYSKNFAKALRPNLGSTIISQTTTAMSSNGPSTKERKTWAILVEASYMMLGIFLQHESSISTSIQQPVSEHQDETFSRVCQHEARRNRNRSIRSVLRLVALCKSTKLFFGGQ